MPRKKSKMARKIGLKPGALLYVGEQKIEKPTIDIIDYDAENLTERHTGKIEDCLPFRDTPTITWININGIHDVTLIEALGSHFDVHPLVLEDIINTGHRPKLEETERYVFVVLKMLYFAESTRELESEQVSVLFGGRTIISFQEKEGDVFAPVRERLKKTVPRVRFMGADYLAYTLLDAVVDHYFVVLETIGEEIEVLEDELVDNPTPEKLEKTHAMKRLLIQLRKSVWPLREVIGGLERAESPHIQSTLRPYLRDLYEHVIQVIDSVETYRDMVSGLLDMYMSSVSNKMNEVMKVLTIIATIFIPLGFLAGVYGMNFNTEASPFNLPELGLRYGYPLFWAVVLLIAGGLFWFFRRRRWL